MHLLAVARQVRPNRQPQALRLYLQQLQRQLCQQHPQPLRWLVRQRVKARMLAANRVRL